MGTFYAGDRVRLGSLRGGIVVEHQGKLRVRLPFASHLLWLDHMVPDEGPDGTIYPNTWRLCDGCGNPSIHSHACINCEARAQAAYRAFDDSERRREDERRRQQGKPAMGIHVAGPIERNGRIVQQCCSRCGAQLVAYLTPTVLPEFTPGECVFAGGLGVTKLFPDQKPIPTCSPVREAMSA